MMRVSSATLIAFLLLQAFAGFVCRAQEKQNEGAIKVQTTLVSVPVIVSDREGRYVSGLSRADFKLFQDGDEQPISYFDAAEEPLNVALVIDSSKSTQPVMGDIKSAGVKFLKELRPQDRAMIVSVDYDVHELSPLTSDRKRLEKAVKDVKTGKEVGTVLRDGIAQIIRQSFKQVDGRKAIIVLTDGKDVGSGISEQDLLDEASESGAMIYTIFFETTFLRRGWIDSLSFPRRRVFRDDRGRFPREQRRGPRIQKRNEVAADFLTRLSDVSAGRHYSSEAADLKKTFNLIAEELRHQYRLGFYPDRAKADGRRHRLRVEVSEPDAVVRARRSYQAASPPSGS